MLDELPSPPPAPEFHQAIGTHRSLLARRAYNLAGEFGTLSEPEQLQAVPQLSGLVAALLEQLHVAEEELRVQNEELLHARTESEQSLRHFRMLFELAPVALIITDSYGTVIEVNRAAEHLTGRERGRLLRKPLVSVVATDQRRAFRAGFSRLQLTGGADDWRLLIDQLGVPVEVSAVVTRLDPTTGGALYWALTRVPPAED
jgi:PAS domain S-box-containing protein